MEDGKISTHFVKQEFCIREIISCQKADSSRVQRFNCYYNKKLAMKILSLGLTFPMWTGIFKKGHDSLVGPFILVDQLKTYYSDISSILQEDSSASFVQNHISVVHDLMASNRNNVQSSVQNRIEELLKMIIYIAI